MPASRVVGCQSSHQTVDNPGLVLIQSEGDTRWVGDQPAHLDDETFVTHAGIIQLTVALP